MIKAEETMHRNSSAQEMQNAHRKLMVISSLEKRTKAKGNKTELFKETKSELRKKIEDMRRG